MSYRSALIILSLFLSAFVCTGDVSDMRKSKITGRVFFDRNHNSSYDKPIKYMGELLTEQGIPSVQLITDDGIVLTTDNNGGFSLSGLEPGTHFLRIDQSSLPENLIINRSPVIRYYVKPGQYTHIDIPAVEYKKNKPSLRAEKIFRKIPKHLNAALFQKNNFEISNDNFMQKEFHFRIFTNYPAHIRSWRIDIYNYTGGSENILKSITGNSSDIFRPIYWDGVDDGGINVMKNTTGEKLFFRLSVTDGKNTDITHASSFIIDNGYIDMISPVLYNYIHSYETYMVYMSRYNNIKVSNMQLDGDVFRISTNTHDDLRLRVESAGRVITELPIWYAADEDHFDIMLPTGDFRLTLLPSDHL